MLAKESPVPLYYQLAEHIRARIQSGELKQGDRLPSPTRTGTAGRRQLHDWRAI